MIDLSSFNETVNKFVEKSGVGVTEAQKKIVFDILAGVIQRTPVDTGRARGNWQLSIGKPAEGETGELLKKTNKTNVNQQGKLASLPPYQIVWITNNVPYIEVLEFGGFVPKNPGPSKDPRPKRKGKTWVKDGYSVQAPQGMVRVTVAKIEASLNSYLKFG